MRWLGQAPRGVESIVPGVGLMTAPKPVGSGSGQRDDLRSG
jgi:hypothetical protein